MSRGPGRVERAVEHIFVSRPNDTFSTTELCEVAFPGVKIEKRHRVSVLRAANNVAARLRWGTRIASKPGGDVIFHNLLSPRSLAVGWERTHTWAAGRSVAEAEEIADDRNARRSEWEETQPGGVWWLHVEIEKANQCGDEAAVAALQEQLNQRVNERISRI